MKVGFIGTGNMGGALAHAAAQSLGSAEAQLLVCCPTAPRRRHRLWPSSWGPPSPTMKPSPRPATISFWGSSLR